MNKNFKIRTSTEADVLVINHFIEPFVQARKVLERTPEELAILTRNGFVVECEGQIVGFAAIEIYSRKLAEVQCLAVDSEFRGQGLATALINRCVELAKEKNVLELMIITSSEEFAMKCGFEYALPEQKRALFLRPTEIK